MMPRKPKQSKEQIIKETYDKIMAQPTEQEQNLFALLAKTYAQGIGTGINMANALQKPA